MSAIIRHCPGCPGFATANSGAFAFISQSSGTNSNTPMCQSSSMKAAAISTCSSVMGEFAVTPVVGSVKKFIEPVNIQSGKTFG
jgi:hypothetical protein